jgi:hypothetical protein
MKRAMRIDRGFGLVGSIEAREESRTGLPSVQLSTEPVLDIS